MVTAEHDLLLLLWRGIANLLSDFKKNNALHKSWQSVKKKSLRNNHNLNSLQSTLIAQAFSNYLKMVVNFCLNGQLASEPGADAYPQQRTSKASENLFQKHTSVMCMVTRQKFPDKTRDSAVFVRTDVHRQCTNSGYILNFMFLPLTASTGTRRSRYTSNAEFLS